MRRERKPVCQIRSVAMHEYDTALKTLLQGSENSVFEKITGAKFGRWLNVELPNVQQTRVDLLFETLEERSG